MKDLLTIALPIGRNLKPSVEVFQSIGLCPLDFLDDTRKLVYLNHGANIRFIKARSIDVPTYVEYGAADMGVVGKDVLLEQEKDVYEPVDLKFGKCRIVLAEHKELLVRDEPGKWSNIRVATKYPNITTKYFAKRGIQVEIVQLYGSIELAPAVGLSERIVDLVSTGRTLAANSLVEIDEIARVTARLIVNRASQKTKYHFVKEVIGKIQSIL